MRQILAFLIALAAISFARAQEKIDTAFIRKIRMEGMNHSHAREIAHYLCEVAGPRLTNSPGYRRASNWAVRELKGWGLSNSTLESFGEYGKGWEVEKFYAALKSPYYQPIVAYPQAYSNGTNGPVTAQVIVLNMMDTTAVSKVRDKLKGKLVFASMGDTTVAGDPFHAYAKRYSDEELAKMGDTYMYSKDMLTFIKSFLHRVAKFKRELIDAGAVGVVRKAAGRDGTAFVDGLYEYKKSNTPGLPEFSLMGEDFMKIARMTKEGPVEMEFDIRAHFYTDDLTGYNVVAEIPGTDPKLKSEVVMLGAHLDSWHSGTGATDNGAGCIVMMEAVRILKALNVQPRRTIRIALWGGEEQGLLGSIGYVRKHFGDPTTMQLKPEQSKISGYFNLDNGTGKIRGVFLQNSELERPIFQKWLEPFADLGATALTASNTGGTDHLSFDAVGIPGFQFIQDPIEYESRTHHSNMDTFDHLYFDDLKQASVIVASFVYNTAMRDEKLPRKPLPKPGEWLFDIDLAGQ